MKAFAVLILYFACLYSAYSQPATDKESHVQSRDLMIRVKAALVALSKTTPVLEGIQSAGIKSQDVRGKEFYHELCFTKNTRTVYATNPLLGPSPLLQAAINDYIIPLPQGKMTFHFTTIKIPGIFAASNSGTVVGPHGINLFVAVEDGPAFREITKDYRLSNSRGSLKFYYYVGMCSTDDKTVTDAEKKVIAAVLDGFGAEFLTMLKSQDP